MDSWETTQKEPLLLCCYLDVPYPSFDCFGATLPTHLESQRLATCIKNTLFIFIFFIYNSTSKVSNDCIKDLRFSLCLHKKLIGVLIK